jgi:hypothetical protein
MQELCRCRKSNPSGFAYFSAIVLKKAIFAFGSIEIRWSPGLNYFVIELFFLTWVKDMGILPGRRLQDVFIGRRRSTMGPGIVLDHSVSTAPKEL